MSGKKKESLFSEEETDFIDEHEYEINSTSNRKINWRRIELVKEQQWLKKQLEDYNDWRWSVNLSNWCCLGRASKSC